MSSVKIIDIAEILVEDHFKLTGQEVEIVFIGKRANEKILECLMTDEEKLYALENDSFYLLTDVTSGEKVFSSYPNFGKVSKFQIRSDQVKLLNKKEVRRLLSTFV